MQATNLRIAAAPLPPAFRGTPSEFFAALVQRMRIVSPDGYYGIVVSDTEPESNQGLWLKGGTKLYVWSDNESKYIPADITDGIAAQLTQLADLVSKAAAGRIIFSATEPAATERTNILWAQTSSGSGAVLSFRVWDPAAAQWRQIPGTSYFTVTTTGATDDQYVVTLDNPADASQLTGIPVIVKFHRTSTGPVTVRIAGVTAEHALVDSATGAQVGAGSVREGQMATIVFDAIEWQFITTTASSGVHGASLITTSGSGTFTVPEGVTQIKVTAVGAGGGGGFSGTAWGGGGGGMAVKWFTVTPGQEIAYSVGIGGAKESAWGAADATSGGDTTFNGTLIGRGGANGGVGAGAGGTHVGGAYGINGNNGQWAWISDKCGGGSSAFPGSQFGATSFADLGAPVRAARYGGGGGGDRDASGNDASDGADGVLLIEW